MEKIGACELEMEGMEVIAEKEHAGRHLFGKVGIVVEVDEDDGIVDFMPGVHRLQLSYLAKFVKHHSVKLVQMNQLKRGTLQIWLQNLGFAVNYCQSTVDVVIPEKLTG